MDYQQAQQMVWNGNQQRTKRKVGNNTWATLNSDGSVSFRLHQTDVVVVHPDGSKRLDSGGWMTRTTKDRINQFTSVGLRQKNHKWFLADGTEFYDGMTVSS